LKLRIAPDKCRFVCVLILSLLTAAGASAQVNNSRVVRNPPKLRTSSKGAPVAHSLEALSTGLPSLGETVLNLNVVYTDGGIWNPATNREDRVRLRSYQGDAIDPNAPFVSPTVEVSPGDTLRITLNNQLPKDPTCTSPASVNTPHCFNGTNLHTHGLWVNPGGNGDNVLISINPGVSFQYEYKIPPDHPAGTFWYHTHRHGSTALQVSSGMAGALIVRGKRVPSATSNGDLDTLLRGTSRQPFTERIVVMQQIQYACRDDQGKIKVDPVDKSYRCDEKDVGSVEGYDQFGPPTWRNSGRYTSINGLVLPTFSGTRAGVPERWRVAHGGVRDTISLQFLELKGGARTTNGLKATDNDGFVRENCAGPPVTQYLIAADGLTLSSAIKSAITVFQPGYRWDALISFPKVGTYCVINAAAPASNVGQTAPSRQLLGFVSVETGTGVQGDPSLHVTDALIRAANQNMPASIRSKVIADMRAGMRLDSFIAHADVKDGDVTGKQTLTFNIDINQNPVQFQIDGRSYDTGRIDRVLRLGGVDEWTNQIRFRGSSLSHPCESFSDCEDSRSERKRCQLARGKRRFRVSRWNTRSSV